MSDNQTIELQGILDGFEYECFAKRIEDAVNNCEDLTLFGRDYMLLPVDADGVPIHVGDRLKTDSNGYSGEFVVFAVGSESVVGDHDIEWVRKNPSKWFHVPDFCHHVKPRTLENVLKAFFHDALDADTFCTVRLDDVLAKYADEIRELLMGGDEE